MDIAEKSPSVLSLCSGYGGLEIALGRALGGINTLAYVEIEAFAIANLVDKMEKGHMVPAPIWTDLKTLSLEPFRDRVDILTGGYPCQPFSAAGKRKGEDDPRHLFPHIKRIITGIRPVWCFFENVEGHISLGLSTVISDLEEMGYETTWGVFSAAEVGAPHQRKRVFLLAHSESYDWRDGPVAKAVTAYHGRGRVGTGFGGLQVRVDSSLARDELADTRLFGPTFCEQQTTRAEQHCEERNELADPRGPELNRISKPEERYCDREARDSGAKLADSENIRRRGGADSNGDDRNRIQEHKSKEQSILWCEATGCCGNVYREELADTGCQGLQRGERPRTYEEGSIPYGPAPECRDLWPARPGEPQHPWEEPRTINGKINADWVEQLMGLPVGWTQLDGGGLEDNRIDRLRLLGNGVVPATAEKAFKTLMRRFLI